MGSAKKPPTPAPGQRSIASFFSPVTKSDANASARGVTSAVSTAMGKRLDADAAASARRDEKENVPLEVETTARANEETARSPRAVKTRDARAAVKNDGGKRKRAPTPKKRESKVKAETMDDFDEDFDGDDDEDDEPDDDGSDFDLDGESEDDDDEAFDVDMSEDESSEEEEEEEDFSESESPVKKKRKAPAKAKAPVPPSTTNGRRKTTVNTTSTVTKSSAPKDLSAADVLGGAGPEQYDARERLKFPFMQPEHIRDAKGRRPDDPEYDPSTLQLPSSFPKLRDANGAQWTVSPGQTQWWRFKAQNFDSVLLFKMGKFYEMYEMDAHIGVRELGLMYMRGEQPHAGFPEKNYAKHAEQLARNGHRVVCIEQTETPAQLAERKKRDKTCKDTVVRREMVQVLTQGTMVDTGMLNSSPDAAYVCCVVDGGEEKDGGGWIGLCAADCGTGRFLVGAWRDDDGASCLRTALAEIRPVEILTPPSGLAARVKMATDEMCARANHRTFRTTSATEAIQDAEAEGYFKAFKNGFPDAIKELRDTACDPMRECGLSAWGTVVAYLRAALVDADLVPQGRIESLHTTDAGDARECLARWAHASHVAMDAAALSGLEVLENTTGGSAGTLLATLDRCASGAGRRLLRRWICRPLTSAAAIRARQQAIAAMRGCGIEATGVARKLLRDAPDTERAVSRVVGSSAGKGRDASRVVLYEDAARARLNDFLAALEGTRAVRDAARVLASCVEACEQSDVIRALCVAGDTTANQEDVFSAVGGVAFPDLSALDEMEAAFDWNAAKTSGRIEPARGVDADLDAAEDRLAAADDALESWLERARVDLGGHKTEVCFVNANKDTHLVEVPDRLASKVPQHWVREGKRKGFERFTCDELVPLRADRESATEAREEALAGVFKRVVAKFCEHASAWRDAASVGAVVDVLASLAIVSEEMCASCGSVCTPKVLPRPVDDAPATLEAIGLSHPCAAALARSFVPNDARLGGSHPAFCLITGPNMGGKSTYLRQVCLAAIMAHVGADVPASSFEMTAMDAVFARAGAKDNLAGGQSTFMVELSETGAMLRRATKHSLVALDELGRGTATADGAAIAHAVATRLVDARCRTLFSTHYHRLADDHARDPNVALAHMACRVESPREYGGESSYGRETVTFLYTLANGACPRSYGVNVARLAGLPERVCLAAARRAAHLEDGDLEKLSLGDAESRERVTSTCRTILRDVERATEADAERVVRDARTRARDVVR